MRFLRAIAAAFLVLACLSLPAGAWAQEADDTSSSLSDVELLDALSSVGLLDTWYETSPYDDAIAGMHLTGSTVMDEARTALIADAHALAQSRGDELRLLAAIEDVEATIDDLEQLARALREHHLVGDQTLDAGDARRLQKALLQTRATDGHGALHETLDAVEGLRNELGNALVSAQRTDRTPRGPAGKEADVRALSQVLGELESLFIELDLLRAEAMITTGDEAELQAALDAALPELHTLRREARTPIDGLPVVTLDAYLRSGAHGIAGCAVDWTLLAGIGRIESHHGTLGESSVALTGAVSPHILGPLLDGGATAREAVEAAEAAEAEIVEQLRLEAEEAARIAAEEEERRRALFGEPTPTPVPTPLFPTPTPEPEPTPEPGEDDDEVPRGNGFAVIEDTDDGVLDGNARWDRAVGPMQFIPGTWAMFNNDGNADGVIDPHNLYDATRSAAAYLCYLERRSGPSPWNYVLGYNASDAYVADVMQTALRLRELDLPARPAS